MKVKLTLQVVGTILFLSQLSVAQQPTCPFPINTAFGCNNGMGCNGTVIVGDCSGQPNVSKCTPGYRRVFCCGQEVDSAGESTYPCDSSGGKDGAKLDISSEPLWLQARVMVPNCEGGYVTAHVPKALPLKLHRALAPWISGGV